MNCVDCVAVAGYDGADLPTLALAMSSRAAGDFVLNLLPGACEEQGLAGQGCEDVAECAVIGVTDELKGQLPVGFLCLNAGVNRPHDEQARAAYP